MLSGAFDPLLPQPIGAIQPYVYGLSKELSRQNKVYVYGYGKGWLVNNNLSIKTFLYNSRILNVTSKMLSQNISFGLALNIHTLPKTISLRRNGLIDIIHVHTPYNALTASALKLVYKVPFVCSLHNELEITFPLSLCDRILANSQYIKSKLVNDKRIDESRVEVLPIAVDVHDFKVTKDKTFLKKEMSLGDRNVILFVGRKIFYKGPQILMRALPKIIQQNPKSLAIFVGPDYSFSDKSKTYTDYLQAMAKKLNVQNNVFFAGYVPDDILKRYYGVSDIFVFPSIWQEPFGKAIIEAMSFEKPVIASNVGGIPEIIINGKNGLLVPPSDVEALAQSVNYLLNNPETAKTIGQKGREIVLQRYSFEKVAEKCSEIYRKIAP
jgi:glycosyltransferase involved in cell wall biosynthesis